MTTERTAVLAVALAGVVWAARVVWESIPVLEHAVVATAYGCDPGCACQCNRTGCGCHGGRR